MSQITFETKTSHGLLNLLPRKTKIRTNDYLHYIVCRPIDLYLIVIPRRLPPWSYNKLLDILRHKAISNKRTFTLLLSRKSYLSRMLSSFGFNMFYLHSGSLHYVKSMLSYRLNVICVSLML